MKKIVDTKKLLFENMARLNPDFKLNEESYSDYVNTNYSADGMDDYQADKDAESEAYALYDIGSKLFQIGRKDEAEKYRQEALQKASSLGWGETDLPPYRSELNEEEKWIQKAVDPKHKGYCTPMTKPTCTPRRKALAKRFKKGIEDEAYGTPDPLGSHLAKPINEKPEDKKSK